MIEVNKKIIDFLNGFESVILATKRDKRPHASVAPVVVQENRFYFLISEVAEHYENIMNDHHGELLFLEDEEKATSPFFRKRVTLQIMYQLNESDEVYQLFVSKFGELVERLVKHMDFHIIEAKVIGGKAVFGAGEAYHINDLLQVMNQDRGSGHGHKKK